MSCSISRIESPRSVAQLLHQLAQLLGLLRVHARGRLVEQQQLRVRRQRARDLEPALVAVGQVHRELAVALEADEVQQLAPLLDRGSSPRACTNGVWRIMPVRRDLIRACMPTWTFSSAVIVRNSLMFWNVRAMPAFVTRSGRLAVMSLPSKSDLAGRRLVEAGQAVEERRLAGAVGPDQRDDRLSAGRVKSTSLTATRPPKTFETSCFENRCSAMAIRGAPRTSSGAHGAAEAASSPSISASCSSSLRLVDGRKPSGRSTIITSSRKPKIPKLIDVTSKSSPILSG